MMAGHASQQDYSRELTIPRLVSEQAIAAPEALALVAGDQRLSYGELNRRANQLAHHLRALGVGPNTLVALNIERSPELIVGLLGILKAGGAYLPLDPSYPAERLAFTLEDSAAPVLLTRQGLAARLPLGGARPVCLDADAATLARYSADDPPLTVTAGDLAYVIYTSGSTGQPKGVRITHGNLLHLIHWHQRAFAVTAADRATQLASPAFDAAGWEVWPYLAAGASLHLPDEETRVSPARLRDWLLAQGITISFLPTPLAERAMVLPWPPACTLRLLLTGGDTLHRHPPAGLPFAVINNYGPTECTVVATSGAVPSAPDAALPPSIDRPIDRTQVYILNERLQPVSSGEMGELCIGGAGVARGYLNRPALTAERFIADPFAGTPGARLYRTGDRVRLLPDGEIAFHGRIDEQIKLRGYRIEPAEIVAALNGHPAVQASTVVARDDGQGALVGGGVLDGEGVLGETSLVAYLVPTPETQPSAGELREYLALRLPGYMVPAVFVALAALPLTHNGKVDRAALPAPDAVNTLGESAFTAPRSPTEERLTGLLAEVLASRRVSVDDNFFLLGGNSLLGTQVIARVGDAFGVELPLRSLFNAPTVAALATEIERLIIARLEAMSEAEVALLLE